MNPSEQSTIDRQSTLQTEAAVAGVGLFTGVHCHCVIRPAGIDSGFVFLLDGREIPVQAGLISHDPVHQAFNGMPPRCSAVSWNGNTVWLVEHVLSALVGLGITNALIELDHCEVPILDGSAKGFVDAILKAGIKTQEQNIDRIVITKPIRIERGDAWIEVLPSATTSYQYEIDYGTGSPITPAVVRWDGQPSQYTKHVCGSRTFCLKYEADAMLGLGLFEHLKQGDMLVFDDSGPIDNTLRDEHECGYHKLLDLIGDIALVGKPILGQVRAHKSGHTLAHEIAKAIVESTNGAE